MQINWKAWLPGLVILAAGLFVQIIDWRDAVIVLLLVIVIHVLLPMISKRR